MVRSNGGSVAAKPARRSRILEWLALVAVVLFLAYRVLVPLADRVVSGALQSLGGIVAAAAAGAGAVVHAAYTDATIVIEHDPLVIALVGEPVVCQPAGQAQYQAGTTGDDFQIAIRVVGSRGAAQANVVVGVSDAGYELRSITVLGGGTSVDVPVE